MLYGGWFVTTDVRKSDVRISGTCCIFIEGVVRLLTDNHVSGVVAINQSLISENVT